MVGSMWTMDDILTLIQVIIGILLVVAILLQQKGTGIGGAFGGGGAQVYSVKRGAEKSIFIATIVLSVIFFGMGIARLLIG